MEPEKVCKICGARMRQRTHGGVVIASEFKDSKIIQDPKKRVIPDIYECEKCGHVE